MVVFGARRRINLFGRANQWNGLAPIAPINAKIVSIYGDDWMLWKKFAHANEAQIRQIRFPIGVTLCQGFKLQQVVIAIECQNRNAVI